MGVPTDKVTDFWPELDRKFLNSWLAVGRHDGHADRERGAGRPPTTVKTRQTLERLAGHWSHWLGIGAIGQPPASQRSEVMSPESPDTHSRRDQPGACNPVHACEQKIRVQ